MNVEKILLNGLIFYLLAIILILPNNTSLLTQLWGPYLAPVANQLGLNNTWEFFSPGPAPTMYLTYTIDTGAPIKDEAALSTTFYFPDDGPRWHFNPNYNRLLYAMRFMVLDPIRLQLFFIPWICRQHPEAVAVSVQHVVEPGPEVDISEIAQSYRHYAEKLQTAPVEMNCPGREPLDVE